MDDTEYPARGAGSHAPGRSVDLTKRPAPPDNQDGFTVNLHKPRQPAVPPQPLSLTKPSAAHHVSQYVQPPSAWPPAAPVTARSVGRTTTVLAAVAVCGIAVIALAGYLLSRPEMELGVPSTRGGTDNGGDIPAAATQCAAPPEASAQSVAITDAGLSVTMELSSPCGSGDVLTDPQLQLTVTDGSHDVAAGVFDTASDPVVIGPGGTATRTFVFTPGTYWQTPETVGAQGSGLSVASMRSGNISQSAVTADDGSSTLTATAAAAPALGTADSAALDGLRALTTADHPVVSSTLANRWVPQISSKQPGLVAEGLTWTASDILREHLELRQRYPEIRLVWSGDWRTFNNPDWWVTIIGLPSNDSSTSLSWCAAQGLDRDHCYAKIVSATMGIEGTTALQK